MAISINNNMMAQTAARNLGASYEELGTSTQRLSSGLRINSAKDDAAGLAVRELIRSDVAALDQGVRNANDAVSMLQAAEGALGEIDENLVRMRQLAEQANTDTYSATQKDIMQNEFNELAAEITRIAEGTDFNDITLLDNTNTQTISLGAGSTTDKSIQITGRDMSAEALGLAASRETATGGAVTSADADYLTAGSSGGSIAIAVKRTDSTTDTLTVSLGADETLSLQETVNKINEQSNSVDSNWDAASVAYDSNTGQYSLKLTARDAGELNGTSAGITTTATDVQYSAGVNGAAAVSAVTTTSVLGSGQALDISDSGAVTTIENAIQSKDEFRAELGYKMNRLEAAASVLQVQSENLSAAESRISDVDVATEMTAMNRNKILAQAGIAMLSQANSMPDMAMKLLQ